MIRRRLDVETLGELLRRELGRNELRMAGLALLQVPSLPQPPAPDGCRGDVSRYLHYSATFGTATRSLLRHRQSRAETGEF